MLRAHLRLLGLLPVVLLAIVLFALPAAAQEHQQEHNRDYHQEYQSQDLATGADDYRQELQQSVPRAKRQPWLIPRLRRDADAEYRAKRYSQAVDDLQKAIAFGADDGLVWLRLAQALAGAQNDHVRVAAYNAYRKSTDPVERGVALFLIAQDYDRHQQFKEALAAFQAGLRFTQSAPVAERVEQLRRLVAFRVTKVELAAEAESPRVCLRFNEKIAVRPDLHYGDYVHTTPELGGIVTARGDTLCLNGLKHGQSYEVELLAGFPAETGDKTIDAWQTRVVVPDRKPSLSFSGTGYVLPREGSAGLPLTSINVDKVHVRLVRINERNLVPSINADKLTMSFDPSDVEELIEQSGSLVWKGEMAISSERNRPVVTAIPVAPILRDKGPGVFLAVVDRTDRKSDEERTPATNWVLVSNLGLTAYTGKNGMDVMVRSLADAKPIADVTLRLFARNNGELTSLKTDASGIAHIAGGLLHGSGGDEPFAVMAYGQDSDFNFLEVGRAAFDLSDRGVSGRAPPGPVDGYLYTDRGIYRPGEEVHLTVLARDDKAIAAPDLPLTLRLIRPDGVEVERRRLTGGKLGAYAETISLARDARIGSWKAELKLDPKAQAIGSIEFRVEDFVPPTLKIALSAADQPVRPGQPFPVEVAANYYYGAPGAGLAVQAQATIAIDHDPFPNEPGFRFGLEDDEFAGSTQDVEAAATDDSGKSTLTVSLKDLPAGLTKPLAATVNVSVFEPSGREVADALTRPIRTRPLAIGLHSQSGDDAVGEGQPAVVEIIALDDDGKRTAAKGLRWELLRERWSYSWYSTNGRWRHRIQRRDEPVEAGIIDSDAAKPVTLSRTLPAGHYRWEVGDAGSGAQTSLRFNVGWYVEAALPDVPDKLSATLDKKTYQPGETAKLFVKAPFAGEAEVAIATDHVVSLRSLSLPSDGATIEIPVDAAWGSGAYALVSAYRPQNAAAPGPGAAAPRGPGRAVGLAWLGVDPAPRTLAVSLAQPDVVRPRGPLEVGVKVAGVAAGEEAYVTLAAVDEAVLKLTEFDSPAPEQYYYGKRQLGVELRDLYGRLIDPRAGGVGVLRSGGDTFAKRAVAGLPDKSSRVVALFSGIVRLDSDGAARIRLDVPDFQGQLRLMAVAFSANKVGSGTGAVTVRDPVVTLVSLPRFLAPGDTAQIGLVINNVEGAAGDYRVTFAASGAGAFTSPVERTLTLGTGAGFNGSFPLQAQTPGNVALHLELSGPGDLKIARDFTLGVRPAQAYQLKRFVGRLEPGQSVTLDDGAAGEFLPGTAEALLTVSPRPDWDVPGLLRSLSRYPYGCIEQTTSRALPLLYVEEVARLWRSDPGYSPVAALDGAIERIVGMQRSDGSFGVWNDSDDTVPFLDAYATDFLLRAKEHGKNVPDYALNSALGWLRDYVRQQHTDEKSLPATAYAHYVLARAKRGELSALRYFNDTQLSHLPSQLAKAQVAAALAAQGDMTRANAAYAAALGPPPKRPLGLRFVDYGSDLRDSAGALAFAADNPAMKPRLTAVMDRITELFAHAGRTSTQEQAWLLMAAEAAAQVSGGEMTVAVDKAAPKQESGSLYFRRVLGAGLAPVSVANRGAAPAWRTISISGVPQADLAAENSGYWVGRWVFRPDGTLADLSSVKQTDLFVVVIKGRRSDAARAARTLVVDLLPAGFEIASASLTGQSATNYDWLKGLSDTAYTEERDDRFIAALDMPENASDFTLAYVVRAVTPGEYKYPALVAEDMYEPENTGRTAIGSLKVQPR
ncbi:MAG: MG2 domain-containing protein [Thiohalocapsa sp.]